MDLKVKVALGVAVARLNTTHERIANGIGISKGLLSMILHGKHKGYKHRAAIARAFGLSEKFLWPESRRAPKKRRAA